MDDMERMTSFEKKKGTETFGRFWIFFRRGGAKRGRRSFSTMKTEAMTFFSEKNKVKEETFFRLKKRSENIFSDEYFPKPGVGTR